MPTTAHADDTAHDTRASCRRRSAESAESGAAVADFALVAGLLSLLFLAVFQVGFALHIRNTLISCASEGARYGARADSEPAYGVARSKELIRQSLADRYADNITATTTVIDGVQVVQIQVVAPLPVVGMFGPTGALSVSAHAFAEKQ